MIQWKADATKKGFSIAEMFVVIIILCMLVALILPAVTMARKRHCLSAVEERGIDLYDGDVEESGVDIYDGDIAYLVLDGRKVQITSRQGNGMYWVRYSDNQGRLEEVSLHYFELADEMPKIEVKDDI